VSQHLGPQLSSLWQRLPAVISNEPPPATQSIARLVGDEFEELVVPGPAVEVLPGVVWDRVDALFTPAFWRGRAWIHEHDEMFRRFRLGSTLAEEVAACLLGGHGMPAEVGLAAFARLRETGILRTAPADHEIERLLRAPLNVRGRMVRYRFPRQKAAYLAAALAFVHAETPLPTEHRAFRDAFLGLPGIGPKTASWITRNWLASDEVAIIDIHILRACQVAGVFPGTANLVRDYFSLERTFLAFARALGVRPSFLDALMWDHMRSFGHLAFAH
jgi:N-glycosylase/DNA lyase